MDGMVRSHARTAAGPSRRAGVAPWSPVPPGTTCATDGPSPGPGVGVGAVAVADSRTRSALVPGSYGACSARILVRDRVFMYTGALSRVLVAGPVVRRWLYIDIRGEWGAWERGCVLSIPVGE